MSPDRVTQLVYEALYTAPSEAQSSQLILEVIAPFADTGTAPGAYSSQIVLEVLSVPLDGVSTSENTPAGTLVRAGVVQGILNQAGVVAGSLSQAGSTRGKP